MNSTTLRTSLTAVAALLLVAGGVACTPDEGPTPTPTLEPAPTGEASDGGGEVPTEQAPETDSEPGPVAGECKVQDGDETLPNEAPTVSWDAVGNGSAPASDTHGPYAQDGELWTCYEHSPTGALLAASYAFFAMGYVPGFADEWIAESDFHDAVAEQENAEPAPVTGTMTPAGYRYVSYSADTAVVDLATEYANEEGAAHLSMRLALKWSGDRWMVDPERSSEEFTPLESLDGYVRWTSNG